MGPAAVTTVLVVAVGYALAWAVLDHPRRRRPWLEALAWAPAVGLGGLSVVFFLGRLLGLPGAGRGSLLALTVAATGALVAARLRRREPPASSPAGGPGAPSASAPRVEVPRALAWALRLALAVTAGALLVELQRWSLMRPFGTADAINIWNVRARFLLLTREPLPELFAVLRHGHPDYPLLLPGSVAAQAGFWGGWDQALPQATGAAFLLGLGAMLHAGLRRLAGGPLATAGTALVLASPVVWRWAFAQCADLPVAYLALAGAAGLAAQLQKEGGPPLSPLLTGWALGMLAWTKNEGLLLALILGAVFLVVWASSRAWAGFRDVLAIGAGAAPGLAVLALFKLRVAPAGAAELFLGGSPAAKLGNAERWHQVLEALGAAAQSFGGGWLEVGVFLGLALAVLATRRTLTRPAGIFLLASLVLAGAGYLVAYVLSPYPAAWHVSTSFERLLLQVFPLAVLWVLSLSPGLTAGSPATSAAPAARR